MVRETVAATTPTSSSETHSDDRDCRWERDKELQGVSLALRPERESERTWIDEWKRNQLDHWRPNLAINTASGAIKSQTTIATPAAFPSAPLHHHQRIDGPWAKTIVSYLVHSAPVSPGVVALPPSVVPPVGVCGTNTLARSILTLPNIPSSCCANTAPSAVPSGLDFEYA